MAYVVRRPGGRWEIRESYSSDAGPRSRTLVTFKVLSPQIISRAARVARRPIDTGQLIRAARRSGVPFESSRSDALAVALLRSINQGNSIRLGLARLLLNRLGDLPDSSLDDSLADWVGASLEERGDALIDLLGLADRLPKPAISPLRFPRFSSTRPG